MIGWKDKETELTVSKLTEAQVVEYILRTDKFKKMRRVSMYTPMSKTIVSYNVKISPKKM